MRLPIKLAGQILKGAVIGRKRPHKIVLELNKTCNLQCKICNIHKNKVPINLPINHIQMLLEKNPWISWIDLIGGEIFLRPDIEELFSLFEAKSKKLKILHFPTNGFVSAIIEKCVQKISQNTEIIVSISIDGPKATHNFIRGNDSSFQRAIETWKVLKKYEHVTTYFGTTISALNSNSFAEMILELQKEIPELNPSQIHFNTFSHSPLYYNDNTDIEMDFSRVLEGVNHAISIKSGSSAAEKLEKMFLEESCKFLSGTRPSIPCLSLDATCLISCSSTIYPCISWNQPVGTLKEFDFNLEKLWASSQRKKIQKQISLQNCPGCWTPCEAYPSILCSPFALAKLFFRNLK